MIGSTRDKDHWRGSTAAQPFRAAVSFEGNDLVLGCGTVLYKLDAPATGVISLRPDVAHDRMIALLAVAGRGHVARAALPQLDAALHDWQIGNRGLAAIRLAFAPLPRLSDRDDAYRLFLAQLALDAGLSPNDLLDELGYRDCTPLLKFDPNQPRVPAGSGARSGQWTSDGSTDGTSGAAFSEPARDAADRQNAVPVFFRPQEEGEDEVSEDKERRLGFGQTLDERLDEGRVLRPPVPGRLGPPGFPDFSYPASPGSGALTVPRLTPSPGGGAPPSSTPPDDKDQGDKGPACPEQENDIPRGPSPNADLFEYISSILVNPDNPTPKNSPLTPNVTSQAYFLPSSAPTGRTSFDDCKQTDVPPLTSIPGLRPGDMVEYKSPWWSWIIFNDWTSGFSEFSKQVRDQNEAVSLEGKGRQVFYCLGDQAAATEADNLYGYLYKSSHFLVCH